MFAGVSRRVHHVVVAVPALVGVCALTVAVSGCATHPAPNPDAATRPVTIEVNNNVTPPVVATIWIQENGSGGARRQLGTAPGAQSTTFTFTPRQFGIQYALTAEPPTGKSLKRNISIDNESITSVKWSLRENVASYFGTN